MPIIILIMNPERIIRFREELERTSRFLSILLKPYEDFQAWQEDLAQASHTIEDAIVARIDPPQTYDLFIERSKQLGYMLNVFLDPFNDLNNLETSRTLFLAGFEVGNREFASILRDEISSRVLESGSVFLPESPWAENAMMAGVEFRFIMTNQKRTFPTLEPDTSSPRYCVVHLESDTRQDISFTKHTIPTHLSVPVDNRQN